MIIYQRNEWEAELRYYFRSYHGATPICELTRKGDHWEVLFYRGATHPGPHVYADFDQARRHILRYILPREEELRGELAWCTGGGNVDHLRTPLGLDVPPPRRTRRRYR